MLDAFAISHLDKWLDRELHSDEPREAVRAAMIAKASDDPEHWLNRGWWDVYYAADCGAILRAHDHA